MLIAYSFPEDTYQNIFSKAKEILKKNNIESKEDWPHISILGGLPNLSEKDQNEIKDELKEKPTFHIKDIEVFLGANTPRSYLVLSLDIPEQFKKANEYLSEKYKIKNREDIKPHSSILSVSKEDAYKLNELLPKIKREVKEYLKPFQTKYFQFWDKIGSGFEIVGVKEEKELEEEIEAFAGLNKIIDYLFIDTDPQFDDKRKLKYTVAKEGGIIVNSNLTPEEYKAKKKITLPIKDLEIKKTNVKLDIRKDKNNEISQIFALQYSPMVWKSNVLYPETAKKIIHIGAFKDKACAMDYLKNKGLNEGIEINEDWAHEIGQVKSELGEIDLIYKDFDAIYNRLFDIEDIINDEQRLQITKAMDKARASVIKAEIKFREITNSEKAPSRKPIKHSTPIGDKKKEMQRISTDIAKLSVRVRNIGQSVDDFKDVEATDIAETFEKASEQLRKVFVNFEKVMPENKEIFNNLEESKKKKKKKLRGLLGAFYGKGNGVSGATMPPFRTNMSNIKLGPSLPGPTGVNAPQFGTLPAGPTAPMVASKDWDNLSDNMLKEDTLSNSCTVSREKRPMESNMTLSIDLARDSKEDKMENLSEMATFKEKITGIPLRLWVSPKNANNGPRVKVIWGDDISQSLSVSIHRENPTVAAGNEKDISKYLLKRVQEWIKLNYDVLMKYWKSEINTDILTKSLKKLPEPRGMSEDNDPDDLFHASNLGSETTGIPELKYMWIFVKIAEHGPRIKAQWGKDYKDSVEFTVHKINPKIIEGNESKLTPNLINKIKKWIVLNYDILLQHWNDYIDSSDAIDGLKKIEENKSNMIESDFNKEIEQTKEFLKENFHLCLVCNGSGKTKSGQPCKICATEWRSQRVNSVEETMVDGGDKDNSSNFAGFDRSWDL